VSVRPWDLQTCCVNVSITGRNPRIHLPGETNFPEQDRNPLQGCEFPPVTSWKNERVPFTRRRFPGAHSALASPGGLFNLGQSNKITWERDHHRKTTMRETNSHVWAFDLGLGSIGAWLGPLIFSALIPFSASDGEKVATGRMRCSRVRCRILSAFVLHTQPSTLHS
jgi:hypothetical protein